MSDFPEDFDRDAQLAQFTILNAPDAIFWVDKEARCHRVNSVAGQLLGYSSEEMEGMTVHTFCPGLPLEAWADHWEHLKAGDLHNFESTLQSKSGERIPVQFSCKNFSFEGQDYICAFVRDERERHLARQTIQSLERQNALILEAAGEGIVGLNLEGTTAFVNSAAATMLGYTSQELIGQFSHSLWHHTKADGRPYPKEECPIYGAYNDGQVHHGDTEVFWRKDGTSFPAEYTSTPMRDEHGTLVGAVVTFRDITEKIQMAARLLEEAKLAEVTRVLGDIGHDIKNMLMPVLSGADLLKDELDEQFPPLIREKVKGTETSYANSLDLIHMIVTNARRIQDRVREIADAVKGVTSPPHFTPCRVGGIVDGVFDTLRTYAAEKGITLQANGLEALPVIDADERRLFNAFYNLINNAIPEVPPGGSVTVSGNPGARPDTVELAVADTGAGMPPDVRERLFTPQSISTKKGGTGLGTKIVKDAIDLHHGHITVESEEGLGTTIRFTLPVSQIVSSRSPGST
jgi:PAS domain S-box-containing protein